MRGIWIEDCKATTHQAIDKVNLRTFQILLAKVVHINLHAINFIDFVAIPDFVLQHHLVLEAATAAARHKHPQTQVRLVFFGQNLF